jgi:hypothetical protein
LRTKPVDFQFEPDGRSANLDTTIEKPFGVFTEGLNSKNSRDDKTAIELFLTGIWGWEAGLRRKLENGKSG